MSRIGRAPITVPAGVTVDVAENNLVTVKGPKGTLTYAASTAMSIAVEGATVTVTRPNDAKENRALHGLTRTLISNMIVGVSEGYAKKLEIVGVGYRVSKEGKKLKLELGHMAVKVLRNVVDFRFKVIVILEDVLGSDGLKSKGHVHDFHRMSVAGGDVDNACIGNGADQAAVIPSVTV